MKARNGFINVRVNDKEKEIIEKRAEEENTKVSEYIRDLVKSDNCGCGSKGYEGIFEAISWKCQKCGRVNKWKRMQK